MTNQVILNPEIDEEGQTFRLFAVAPIGSPLDLCAADARVQLGIPIIFKPAPGIGTDQAIYVGDNRDRELRAAFEVDYPSSSPKGRGKMNVPCLTEYPPTIDRAGRWYRARNTVNVGSQYYQWSVAGRETGLAILIEDLPGGLAAVIYTAEDQEEEINVFFNGKYQELTSNPVRIR